MLKLIKYELIKAKSLLIAAAIVLAVIEGMLIIGKTIEDASLAGIGIFLFIILFFFGLISLLIFAVKIYVTDLKNKHGYMLFLTPRNAYQILGSKLITSFISFIAGFIVYVALAIFNIYLYTEGSDVSFFGTLFKGIYDILGSNAVVFVVLYIFMYMLQWFTIILMVYFAVTLTYTFLGKIKGKTFIIILMSLGMYIAMSTLTSFLLSDSLIKMLNSGTSVNFDSMDSIQYFINEIGYKIIGIGYSIYITLSIIFYLVSSFIVQRKLSL